MTTSEEREQILREIISLQIISTDLKPGEINLDSYLLSELKLDELDRVEIFLAIENEFDLPLGELPEEICDSFKTPRDILNYLNKINAQERPGIEPGRQT